MIDKMGLSRAIVNAIHSYLLIGDLSFFFSTITTMSSDNDEMTRVEPLQ